MNIENEILINKFGQDLIFIDNIKIKFDLYTIDQKKEYLNELINLIIQSKPIKDDINIAILESKLKETYTPCVLIKKGLENHNLKKLINLPENELDKSLVLLLNLFKISYKRRYEIEKNNPNKWWYWDLSIEDIIMKIKKTY